MQLTLFSDYGLRVALYLAAHPDTRVKLEEISQSYGVSKHHLVKVVQRLVELGVVDASRGRGGGLQLARPPEQVNVGQLVRDTEPHFDLVECFDAARNTCPIDPACGLKGVLRKAQQAFLNELDAHTLADFVPRATHLIPLWRAHAARR